MRNGKQWQGYRRRSVKSPNTKREQVVICHDTQRRGRQGRGQQWQGFWIAGERSCSARFETDFEQMDCVTAESISQVGVVHLTLSGDRNMLVLTRSQCQGIRIGKDIRIVVLGIQGGKVRLGIDAPKNVQVHRDEIWSAIQEQQTKGKAA